jgi:hypothetical protein
MGRLRQGSRVRRAAIGVAALYAVLLHALLAALAPAASFAFPGGIETYQTVWKRQLQVIEDRQWFSV